MPNRESGDVAVVGTEFVRDGERRPWEVVGVPVGIWPGGTVFDPAGGNGRLSPTTRRTTSRCSKAATATSRRSTGSRPGPTPTISRTCPGELPTRPSCSLGSSDTRVEGFIRLRVNYHNTWLHEAMRTQEIGVTATELPYPRSGRESFRDRRHRGGGRDVDCRTVRHGTVLVGRGRVVSTPLTQTQPGSRRQTHQVSRAGRYPCSLHGHRRSVPIA